MAERVSIALIGCGGMGRRHLRGLAVLAGSSQANVELVAACDLNLDNANFLADEAVELIGHRPRVFSNVDAMAGELGPDLQAVTITTEAAAHHRAALEALDVGWHLLCEKPLALTVRASNAIIEAAQRAGRIVSVAENYRRDPINRLAHALIRDGAVGTPRLMVETNIGGKNAILITPWRHMKNAASMPVDAGIHHADIQRYYMGEVASVYGETRLHERVRHNTAAAGPGGYYARWSAAYPDQIEPTGDDALYAHLTYESGAVGQWIDDHAGHGAGSHVRQVFGSTASLELPGDRNGRPIVLHLDDGTKIRDERILDYAPSYGLEPLAAELFGGERVWTYDLDFNATDGRILALEYYELARCVLTGQQPEVTAEEGRADLALTYAPFESGRLGRPVTMAEMLDGTADVYQREIDEHLGLLPLTA